MAAWKGRVEFAKILVSAGANINASDNNGTPLHQAAAHHNVEMVQYLVSQGANVNARNRVDRTPLHDTQAVEIAKILVSNGADVNAKDKSGLTPLDWARMRPGLAELVEYLSSLK